MSATPARATLAERAVHHFDECFAGSVEPWIYALLRSGLAALCLIRGADWLRPWLALDHHLWVRGFDLDWSTPASPYLTSPVLPGLVLGRAATHVLVRVRSVLAALLLVGVHPRASALALSAVSYALLLSDRYHYFHHLHLLYLSVAWLALVPENDPFRLWHALTSLVARLRAHANPDIAARLSAIWPLQLLRALVMSIYLASGSAKLQSSWCSGQTLTQLARLQSVQGELWAQSARWLGVVPIARGVCLFELALPVLLAVRATRRVAVLTGILFHVLISSVMAVSTFGATMALLLLAFWPDRVAERELQDAV